MRTKNFPGWLLSCLLCLSPVATAAQDDPVAVERTLAVEVEGLNGELPGELADNIRAYLAVERIKGEAAPMASRLQYLHRQAADQIRTALQPFGYYRPVIKTELLEQQDRWLARYQVDPGEQVRLENINVAVTGDAETDPQFMQALADSTLRKGQPLRHADYETLKSRLQSLASERGYYDAVLSRQQLLVNPQLGQADIELVLDSGPRYRIGAVNFSAAPVDEALLSRFVPFESGDPVSSARLLELQRGLAESDYFSRVEVQPSWDKAVEHAVPIDVLLEPNKRTAYRFGAGYGTDTGARVSANIDRRWVNRRGHSANSLIQLSEVESAAAVQYNIPGQKPQTDRYSARLAWESELTDTTDSEIVTLGVLWKKQLGSWQRLLSVDWEQERYTLDDETSSTSFLIPGMRWSTTNTDNPLNPSRGYRLSLELNGASEVLLSEADFVQAQVKGKHVLTLNNRTRLLTRADVGMTAMDDFSLMPSSHRFFAGGDNSVRGYDYKELGPEGSNGDVVGGRYLLVGSAELDYRVAESWRVAAFYDAGNALDSLSEPLKSGAGIGVRWQSPIGPVRLDLAKPLEDSGFRIHFTLGPDL
ncbi:autotransporter assembly complex protein TamA [Marinobacterium rhizophilum]|uniref:autotransporter assembly complex protein TamA n=1 Tax=Marinobacterium rhizophilum TaxID=420402 RepID=UPI0003799757|nr:autotransporter assembly complex family protein [Marinobacterium rhizophilum]